MTPRIGVTFGDPAGIGPEIVAKLLDSRRAREDERILLIADRNEIDRAARLGKVDLGWVDVADVPSSPEEIPAGVSAESGAVALDRLRVGVELAQARRIDGLLFGPLNTASMKHAGMAQQDELRWFASQFGTTEMTSEINVLGSFMTARVTSHIPLRDVANRITSSRVVAAAQLLHRTLRAAGVASPRIAVAALNPHAGDSGTMGREEIDEIEPGVRAAREAGVDAHGPPYPADTLFATRRDQFDGVVTMFHDQGQIALKLLGFDKGITLEAGLPVPIATPAHGTAFDITGTGTASWSATEAAYELVVDLARSGLAERHRS